MWLGRRMWRGRQKRGTKLRRQVALGLLQDAMARADPAGVVVVGVPGGPEVVEYMDGDRAPRLATSGLSRLSPDG